MRKGWLAYIEQTYAVDPDHSMVELDRVIWSFLTMSDGCEVLGLLDCFSH
jgi:hypothetical protein